MGVGSIQWRTRGASRGCNHDFQEIIKFILRIYFYTLIFLKYINFFLYTLAHQTKILHPSSINKLDGIFKLSLGGILTFASASTYL